MSIQQRGDSVTPQQLRLARSNKKTQQVQQLHHEQNASINNTEHRNKPQLQRKTTTNGTQFQPPHLQQQPSFNFPKHVNVLKRPTTTSKTICRSTSSPINVAQRLCAVTVYQQPNQPKQEAFPAEHLAISSKRAANLMPPVTSQQQQESARTQKLDGSVIGF